MNRRKKLFLLLVAFLCVAALVVTGQLLWGKTEYQSVSLQGYSMMVPKAWEVKEEGSTLYFQDDSENIGQFTLIYHDMTVQEIPQYIGYSPEDITWRDLDGYGISIHEAEFRYERSGYTQYIFAPLKDAPPYQAVLSLKRSNSRKAKEILRSFRLPDLGVKVPEKPLAEPDETFLSQAVYTKVYNNVKQAYHVSTLDRLMLAGTEQPIDDASVVHILSYAEEEIETWYYLSVGAGQKKLFTYKPLENGQYYYENNPRWIKNLSREVSEDGTSVCYMADDILLLEVPYNTFLEQKNDLFALKGTYLDDEGKVSTILQKILPKNLTQGETVVNIYQDDYGIVVPYVLDVAETYVQDGTLQTDVFFQNSFLLFGLIDDLDWVRFRIRVGDEIQSLMYHRTEAEIYLQEQNLSGFTKDMRSFENFLELLPLQVEPQSENE